MLVVCGIGATDGFARLVTPSNSNHCRVEPPVADAVSATAVSSLQYSTGEITEGDVGVWLTVTFMVFVPAHPLASVPVTVYTPDVVGVIFTLDSEVPTVDHEYVPPDPAPLAERIMVSPKQIVLSFETITGKSKISTSTINDKDSHPVD